MLCPWGLNRMLLRLAPALLGALLCALPAGQARAVPPASHVRLECYVLRLNVNGSTERRQLKMIVTVSSSEQQELEAARACQLVVRNAAGTGVSFNPRSVEVTPKRFKAGHTKLLFKVVEDAAVPELSNVPRGFFGASGPYSVRVKVGGKDVRRHAGGCHLHAHGIRQNAARQLANVRRHRGGKQHCLSRLGQHVHDAA